MRNIFRIFFSVRPAHAIAVTCCLIVASLLEGIGLASLLPIITIAGGRSAVDSPAEEMILSVVDKIGLDAELGSLILFLVIALVLKSIISFFSMSFVGFTAADVATNLRFRIINNLMNVRWRFLVRQPLGRITNVVSNDATRVRTSYQLTADFVALAAQTVILSVVALIVSWKLALTAFAMGIVILLALHVLVRVSRKAGRAQTLRTRDLTIFLSDTLSNLKVIRAMNRHQPFANLLHHKINRLRKALRLQVVSSEAVNHLQDAAMAVFLGGAFYFLYQNFTVALPELLVSGIVVAKTVGSIGKLQKTYQKAALLESAFTATEDLIRETEADPEPPRGSQAVSLRDGVKFRSLTFAYEDDPVLDRIDLDIRKGQLTVLLGPSGSGKSTIVDLLFGLYRPTGGQLLIDDVSIGDIDLKEWRNMLGYVPQDVTLLHDTVLVNLTMGDETVTDDDVWKALDQAGMATVIRDLPDRLSTVVGERGSRFSGGQRQRLALARALIRKPRLLVLDEVTSALDHRTATKVAAQIHSLVPHVTVLAVTHRPEFVDVADSVYRVEHGRVMIEQQQVA